MKTKHTPGPWHIGGHVGKYEDQQKVSYIGIGNGSDHIARAVITGCVNEPTAWANAQLIQAAPELLKALELFVGLATDSKCIASLKWTTARDAARAAITKATQP